jgi:EAL domain-containing protein (putative c-di-GMP-specific phosphodiesterase class I)
MQEHGCDEIQGYLLSRPIDAASCAEFCRKHTCGAWRVKAAGSGH